MKNITRVKKRLASATSMVSNAISAMDVVRDSYPEAHMRKQMATQTLELLERPMDNINAMRETLRFELSYGEEW